MERKIEKISNSPLMYITQPIYPTAKPKMQQSYVAKPRPIMDEIIEIPQKVQNTVEKVQTPVENVSDETQTSLKKNSTEEKTTQKKNQSEENEPIAVSTNKPISKPIAKIKVKKLNKLKKLIDEKQELVEKVVEESPVMARNIEEKAETNNNVVKEERKQDHPIEKSKRSNDNILESREAQEKMMIEQTQSPLEKIIKEKLPSLGDLIEGKSVHINNQFGKQPLPLETAKDNLQLANTDHNDEKKSKKSSIVSLGIKASIEKGKKVAAKQKKQLPSPINHKKAPAVQIQELEQNKKAINQQDENIDLPETQQEDLEQMVEMGKPQRPKSFKEMSTIEKVEYLVHLPAAVPKVKCDIKTKEYVIQGIIAGYVNGVVQIVQRKKPYRIEIKIEDIISINRKSF